MCDVLAFSDEKIKTTRDQVTTTQSNTPVSNFVLSNSVDSLILKGGMTIFFKFPKKNFFCFIVFLYMSAGCVSTIRTCVQVYLEKLPFVFASYLHFTFCD